MLDLLPDWLSPGFRFLALPAARRAFDRGWRLGEAAASDAVSTPMRLRARLLREDFPPEVCGELLGWLHAREAHPDPDQNLAWAASLMLHGWALALADHSTEAADYRAQPGTRALLLAAMIARWAGVSVTLMLGDERRVAALIEGDQPLLQRLGVRLVSDPQSGEGSSVWLTSPTRLARSWLREEEGSGGELGTRAFSPLVQLRQGLQRLQHPFTPRPLGDGLLLVEYLDLWRVEKGFAAVTVPSAAGFGGGLGRLRHWQRREDLGKPRQLLLHELFGRYRRVAGSLIGEPDGTLARAAGMPSLRIGNRPPIRPLSVQITPDGEEQVRELVETIRQLHAAGRRVCLLGCGETGSTRARQALRRLLPQRHGHSPAEAADADLESDLVLRGLNPEGLQSLLARASPVLVEDGFPWLVLEQVWQRLECEWLLVDFHPSPRLLVHLRQSPITERLRLVLAADDPLFAGFLDQSPMGSLGGEPALRLLGQCCARAERQRRQLHGEMSRWLAQIERLFGGRR